MGLGILLIIIGIILALLINWWIGVICVIVGLILIVTSRARWGGGRYYY